MFGSGSVLHAAQDLDAPIEIAVHEVGRADPVLRIAVVREVEDPGVLEEPTEDRAHA